jgi:uracil-DNA glycosylase
VTWEDANVCWPVHEALFSIIQPRLILAFGNSSFSPYAYLHWRYGGEQTQVDSGHGTWKLKGFHTRIADKRVFVAGLPHLSRYNPIGKQSVIDWIQTHQRQV